VISQKEGTPKMVANAFLYDKGKYLTEIQFGIGFGFGI
jgi:hypothetical protein